MRVEINWSLSEQKLGNPSWKSTFHISPAQRLTRIDDSVDGSSIGQGAWDPVRRRNVPYVINGEAIRDHLSIYYRSSYAFAGRSCEEWAACA